MKAEAKIEKYLVDQVRLKGGFSRKYISPGVRGVPDRIIFLHGHVAFVEVKSSRGKLSGLQVREIHRMIDAGAKVYVVSSEGEVDKCLNMLLHI